MRIDWRFAGVLSLLTSGVRGIEVDWNDDGRFFVYEVTRSSKLAREPPLTIAASVKEAASTIAFGLLKYYTGNNTGDVPGNLPDPYFCTLQTRPLPGVCTTQFSSPTPIIC